MARQNTTPFLENLVFAVAMGLLAVALITAGYLVDARRSTYERRALAALAKRPTTSVAAGTRVAGFGRIYRIGGKGDTVFGLVLSLRTSRGAAIAAALFTPDGELEAVRILSTSEARQPYESNGWFAGFLGKGGRVTYPALNAASMNVSAVSGASESFIVATQRLEEASSAVRLAAGERL